ERKWCDEPDIRPGDEIAAVVRRGADYRFRQSVMERCLETLFKTYVPGLTTGYTLLDSFQVVETALARPLMCLNWPALAESNDDYLCGLLERSGLRDDRREFERLCRHAVAHDLSPLAERLGCSFQETCDFLRHARHLRVIDDLALT